jgi:hypothetical protein
MTKIELHIEPSGQITARFVEGEEAAKIRQLFGSDRIPTPWTFDGVREIEHHGAVVLTAIRKLNPNAIVCWNVDRCAEFIAFCELQDFRREFCGGKVH